MTKNILPILLLSSCTLLYSNFSVARENRPKSDRHKLFIKAGIGALPGDVLGKSPVSPLNRYKYERTASYHASVQYFIGKNTAISLSGGYYKGADQYQTPAPAADNPNNSAYFYVSGYAHSYSFSTKYVALEGHITYFRSPKLGLALYGGAGLAVTHTKGYTQNNELFVLPPNVGMCGLGYNFPQQIDENKLKTHISLVGIRGGKKVGWYAEGGYGYKGIVNAGITYRL